MKLLIMLWRWFITTRVRFHGRKSRLDKAIRKANRKHRKNGKRYRVFFLGMRYRVYTRDDIKDLKKAGIFRHFINSTTIDPVKFYDTNDLPCLSQ